MRFSTFLILLLALVAMFALCDGAYLSAGCFVVAAAIVAVVAGRDGRDGRRHQSPVTSHQSPRQ